MGVVVRKKGLKVTKEVREFVDKEIDALLRYDNRLKNVNILLEYDKDKRLYSVLLGLKGYKFLSKHALLDKAVSKSVNMGLKRLREDKSKYYNKKRRSYKGVEAKVEEDQCNLIYEQGLIEERSMELEYMSDLEALYSLEGTINEKVLYRTTKDGSGIISMMKSTEKGYIVYRL